jgi:transposase-like protein
MDQEDEMMENGKRRARRQLLPEEKWELFLEVTSQELSPADAARKWGVDVSVIIRLRALAKDAALAAFASAKPGRPASAEAVELELLRAESDRLSEALKELAVELTLHRGGSARAFGPGAHARAAGPKSPSAAVGATAAQAAVDGGTRWLVRRPVLGTPAWSR